jgi:hypothetical protein
MKPTTPLGRWCSHLLEGALARLAGLQLNQVEDLFAVSQNQVVVAHQDGLTLHQVGFGPLRLRSTRSSHRLADRGGRAVRILGQHGPRPRGDDLQWRPLIPGEWYELRQLAESLPADGTHLLLW